MSVIVKTGSMLRVADDADIQILDVLPPKVFVVGIDLSGFFLKEIQDFNVPEKIYGSSEKDADRILKAFDNRDLAMGVHLDGMKGSGKTLLTKIVSQKMGERNSPTILINAPFSGDGFNSFIQSIEQEAVVIFDEFEKIFDEKDQGRILTLLDGVYPSRKLYMITTNEDCKVSDYMKNRPGRVYYKMGFNKLEEDFIRDMVDDKLINKEHRDELILFTKLYPNLNFDMLNAVINEMNDFSEPVRHALRYLNVKPDGKQDHIYNMSLFMTAKDGTSIKLNLKDATFNPMEAEIYLDESNMYQMDADLIASAANIGLDRLSFDGLKRNIKRAKNVQEGQPVNDSYEHALNGCIEVIKYFSEHGKLDDNRILESLDNKVFAHIRAEVFKFISNEFEFISTGEYFTTKHLLDANVDENKFVFGIDDNFKLIATRKPIERNYNRFDFWA